MSVEPAFGNLQLPSPRVSLIICRIDRILYCLGAQPEESPLRASVASVEAWKHLAFLCRKELQASKMALWLKMFVGKLQA